VEDGVLEVTGKYTGPRTHQQSEEDVAKWPPWMLSGVDSHEWLDLRNNRYACRHYVAMAVLCTVLCSKGAVLAAEGHSHIVAAVDSHEWLDLRNNRCVFVSARRQGGCDVYSVVHRKGAVEKGDSW
jgi:hypothetical protein